MNRKKLIPILLIVIAAIAFLVLKITKTLHTKNNIKNNIAYLPSFGFYNMQHQIFTKDSLVKNKPCLFIFYNSDCEHCQYEASEIVKNAAALKNSNILFVSNQSYAEINRFDSIYHLTRHPFITLLRDSTDNFYKTFGTAVVPSLIIYNSKGNLLNNYKGEVSIIKVINQLK